MSRKHYYEDDGKANEKEEKVSNQRERKLGGLATTTCCQIPEQLG
jgi:hypothetical protein